MNTSFCRRRLGLPMLIGTLLINTLIAISTAIAAPQLDPEEPIDLELKQAPLVETLKSFASISGSRLDVDPEVTGSVTLALERTPWRQVLDQICRVHRLNCELLSGEPPVLRVRSTRHAEGAMSRPGYAQAIDMSLKGADLRQTLQAFGAIGGIEVIVDDAVSGVLTIEIEDAPWTVVLEEACNLSGCRVEWGTALHILPEDQTAAGGRRAPLAFDRTPVAQALATIASRPIFGALGQPELTLAADLEGTVSLELGQTNWLEALNAVCQAAACRWQLIYGAPSRLSVRAKQRGLEDRIRLPAQTTTLADAAHLLGTLLDVETELDPDLDPQTRVHFTIDKAIWRDAAEELCRQADCFWSLREGQLRFNPRVKVLSQRPVAEPQDRRARIRFSAPNLSESIEGTVRFNWASPIRTFELSGEARWLARLSWIPLGPGLDLIVPTLSHCDADGIESKLLTPIRLPLEELVTRRWRGANLEISRAPAEDRPSPRAVRVDCSEDVAGELRATFRRSGAQSTDHEVSLDLEARVGTYLLVTPPGPGSPAPVAAVLALGTNAEGIGVALIRPTNDRIGFRLSRRTLPTRSELKETIMAPNGVEFELRLHAVE